MSIDSSTIFNILTNPPGDLIYHLVSSFALALTLIFAIVNNHLSNQKQRVQHVLLGCSILLAIQITVFGSFHVINNLIPTNDLIFSFIERLASTLTIIWLVWTYIEDDQHFILTGITIFLSLILMLITTAIIVTVNLQPPTINIRESAVLILWHIGSFLLILISLILIFTKRPHLWIVLTAQLVVLAAGHILQISLVNPPIFHMGAVRLTQILSIPWIIVLIQRFPRQTTDNQFIEFIDQKAENQHSLVDTKPTLVNLLLKVALHERSAEKFKSIVQAIGFSAVADICYLVQIPADKSKIQLIAGYDLIREVFLPTSTLSRDDLIHIMDAWEENTHCTLSKEHSSTLDFNSLTLLLNYHQIGNLLAYPLSTPDQPLAGGILLLSPYTNKHWGKNTIKLLDEIKDTLSQVLFNPDPQERLKSILNQKHILINKLLEEQEGLTQALVETETALMDRENLIKQLKANYQIEKIETVKNINLMKDRISDLTEKISSQKEISSQVEQLKTEIRLLVNERDQLKSALAQAHQQIENLDTQSGQTGPIRLSLDNQIISLDSIVANIRLKVAEQLQQKNIDLEVINPDGRQMVKTDPELLQSAVFGLLQNAISASEQGGTIQLSQKIFFETGMLIIEVTDFGEGLTQKEQADLFNAEHEAISGIGNIQSIRDAIRAIRVLNGKIWLRSKKQAFTTFRFQLPVRIID